METIVKCGYLNKMKIKKILNMKDYMQTQFK